MTDQDTEQQPTIPEMDSYTITTQRTFEVDLSAQQVAGMRQRTNTDDPEEAIEQTFLHREVDHIEPEQKLMGVTVNVDGPSDDEE